MVYGLWFMVDGVWPRGKGVGCRGSVMGFTEDGWVTGEGGEMHQMRDAQHD
jgi:hypothetical protein